MALQTQAAADLGIQNLEAHTNYRGIQPAVQLATFKVDVDAIDTHLTALEGNYTRFMQRLITHGDYIQQPPQQPPQQLAVIVNQQDFQESVKFIKELLTIMQGLAGGLIPAGAKDLALVPSYNAANTHLNALKAHRSIGLGIQLDGLDLDQYTDSLQKYMNKANEAIPTMEQLTNAALPVPAIAAARPNAVDGHLQAFVASPLYTGGTGHGFVYEGINFKKAIDDIILELAAVRAQVQQAQVQQAPPQDAEMAANLEKVKLEFSTYKSDTATEHELELQRQVDACRDSLPEIIYVEKYIEKPINPRSIEVRLANQHKNVIVNGNDLIKRYRRGLNLKFKTGRGEKKDIIFNAIDNAATHLKDKYDDKVIIVLTNQNNVAFTWRDKEYYQQISASNNIYIYLCEYVYTKGKCPIKNPDVNFYTAILADKLKCRVVSDKDIKIDMPVDDCIFTVYMIEPDYGGVIKTVKFKYTDFPEVQTPYTISFKNI